MGCSPLLRFISESIGSKIQQRVKQDTKLVSLLRNAVEASSDKSGWAQLGPVGSNIAKQSSEFDPRNYGYGKLGGLVSATKLFDIEERQIGTTNSKALYVRDKRKK
ncbi:MAG: OST-HTH/LOTUS domain-containing protein [Deltaproteobacteria bacterium]|nr:OST-HTH/LOTUS domain-containing protein [Deltaproteobacteria bacterium]